MADTQSTQMGRGKNARRNKSTASVGSKKNRTASTSTIKFQPNVDGFSAFLVVVSKLGKNGQEFTWHDLRKVYHRDTQRVLNAEELNAIFNAKNLTKREVFELPKVKRFLVSMDGSMMCRFRLISNPEDYHLDDIPPLMTASTDSDIVTQSTASPITSQDGSPTRSNDKSIAISTDCEVKVGPTSDLSKSEVSPSEVSLSHQASVQSSLTDDEGWGSGRDTRSQNSSPVGVDECDGPTKKKCADLEDDVFEVEERIAAGSDQVDGAVINDVMIVEQAKSEDVIKPEAMSRSSPLLVTDSVEAAFQAIQNQLHNDSASATISETTTVSEQAKVHATPRKVKAPVPAERKTITEELASGPPIKQLIEKFDTGVNFADHKPKAEGSPSKSIYAQVLDEIRDEKEKQTDQLFVLPKKEEHEETEITNVIFRSASTHSSIIAQEKEQLAKFTAEVEAKIRDKPEKKADTTADETEAAFGVKEQSSMSSLDREYFDSKMVQNEDLFTELGVQDADGFQLKTGSKNTSAVSAQKSGSDESGPASLNLVTVIEKTTPEAADRARIRTESLESDADVPYSLCSEDEAEPITTIEKSMKVSSHSAEQLSPPKEEKPKTVVVNVELDAKSKREPGANVKASIKERIAALQAAGIPKQVPMAKIDSIDEKDEIHVLHKSEELEHIPLEVKPATQATGSSIRRRQGRFMRGCCTVQ